MKEVKCMVVTTTGTFHTSYYYFDGITIEAIIEQMACQGIYHITGIIEEVK